MVILQGLTDKNLLRKGTFSFSENRGQAMEQREQKPNRRQTESNIKLA
ncbi:MAG: hypothetical protein ACOCNA_06885 [Prevotella pectinovora]